MDVLDRLDLGPGPEDVWRCFARAPALDLDAMVAWASRLGSSTLAARLGVFFEHWRGTPRSILRSLARMRPNSPVLFEPGKQGGIFMREWNVVVPRELLKELRRDR